MYPFALAEKIPGDGSYVFEEIAAIDAEDVNPCQVLTNRRRRPKMRRRRYTFTGVRPSTLL